jgi:hypothetical protein
MLCAISSNNIKIIGKASLLLKLISAQSPRNNQIQYTAKRRQEVQYTAVLLKPALLGKLEVRGTAAAVNTRYCSFTKN